MTILVSAAPSKLYCRSGTTYTPAADGSISVPGGPDLIDALSAGYGFLTSGGTSSLLQAADALVAHAGGGQANALALTAIVNRVITVATAADSVVLPAAKQGMEITVINAAAANAMNVYPASGELINALTADTALSVAANKTISFFCAVAGKWNSQLTA